MIRLFILLTFLRAVTSLHLHPRCGCTVAAVLPDPRTDPFYQAPEGIREFDLGEVIRCREVTTLYAGRSSRSYQVLYRTSDNTNEPVATVATIWTPANPTFPPRILSFQQAEDGVNTACSPSWGVVNATSPLSLYYQLPAPIVSWGLSQGHIVVASDFEGPNSTWLVGKMEGQGTLDGIRSAMSLFDLPRHSTEASLIGYSGGGHATAWASILAKSYAPELKIVGAALGGVPTDLRATYELLNRGPKSLIGLWALLGIGKGYPEVKRTFTTLLTSSGKDKVESLLGAITCVNSNATSSAGFDFNTLFSESPLDHPTIAAVVESESLVAVSTKPTNSSHSRTTSIDFPMFVWHGTNDTTVPYGPEAAFVSAQCAQGADVRFLTLPGLDHESAYAAGLPGALSFVQRAFDGALESSQCGNNVTVPVVGSAAAIGLLGLTTNFALSVILQLGQ